MIASLLWSLAAAAVVVQIAVFGTTIYLHRAAAHRAVTLHPVVSWVFRMAIWLTTGIVPREWVAVHRKHHAFTDEEGDPHSPRLEGFWKIQLGNVFYYIRETRNRETMEKYAKDMKPDFWDRALFDRGNTGLLVGTAILCAVLGIGWGLLAAGIHAFTYIFLLSSSINGLCHWLGYKNFDNTATNLRSVALVTGGEGLHNNHHGRPRSARFSFHPSEIDPAWWVIRTLSAFRLASPVKIPS